MRLGVFVAALLCLTSAYADDADVHPAKLSSPSSGSAPMLSAETAPTPANEARSAAEAAKENPLWSTPLSRLTATRERPLFSPSRRPPAAAVPVAVAPRAAPPPPPPAPPAAPETSPFGLIGTVLGSNVRFAVLIDRTNNTVTRLREGETEQGWTARKVDRRTVLLEKNGTENMLELPKAADPPPDAPVAPTADADPPAKP